MVVVCWTPMSTDWPVLVAAGPLAERTMHQASDLLARGCGVEVRSHPVGADPQTVLMDGSSADVLLRLCGDAARLHPCGGNWLEALADWRRPVLLLVPGEADGGVPGTAAAYTALCRQLGVRLLGLVQLQGTWNQESRRRDGLPWCGWLPAQERSEHSDATESLCRHLRTTALRAAATPVRRDRA